MYVRTYVRMYVCVYVCVLCGHTQNMPHAMKSGERHEVRGVSGSVAKRAGADHHGKGWFASGAWRKQMVVEGSLEAKLPTIWTDEKQRWEESEKRREKKRREEERRSKK